MVVGGDCPCVLKKRGEWRINDSGSGVDSTSEAYLTSEDFCWTGRWGTFALGWQETVFEDVLYPGGILKIPVGLLERRDGVIDP